MERVRILVDTLADEDLTNAQMVNGRDIIRRLDPARFHVTTFVLGTPDPSISKRPNTRLIKLPNRLQTAKLLREFVCGSHDILFYMKASPASRCYMSLRSTWRDSRVTVGTLESQSNWRSEPTIAQETVRLIERTVLRCDHLFSNSRKVKKSLEVEYGLPSGVVPTGVDAAYFTPDLEHPENLRVRVLFVGSLRPFKGPGTVLEAAKRFPEFDFVIVGDGILADELGMLAKRLPNVRLTGAISRAKVRDEYRRADIFLFPSTWEGSPKVIMEAAACGLPVIARNDYEPETVIDGQTGYLATDEGELFARLAELSASPQLRRRMGQAGRAHIQNFDWNRVTRQWEDIFLRLAAERNGNGHR